VGRLTDLDLKTFHQDNTLLAGHPPATGVTDIPFATGSLGHGLSLAAGTALAMQLRGQPDRVFCMTSDGEWQEGSTWEALIFACHHKLTNLTVLVDHNGLQGFGTTAAVASMSPLHEKLLGFDVQVTCVNGHDLSGIRDALCVSPPKLHIIVLETIKGNGVRFMENKLEWHYLPLSLEQFHAAMEDIERI
jgi:transketolase